MAASMLRALVRPGAGRLFFSRPAAAPPVARCRLFSTAPANLTLAEPAPAPVSPVAPRKNFTLLDGGVVRVDVEAFFGDAAEARSIDLPAAVFAAPLRVDVLHDCVRWQRNKRRQMHRASKRRGEIAGSTRKIYKQKGTGNARMGSVRSPVRRGGGKAHGPAARDFRTNLNKKVRRLGLRVAISAKLREGRLTIVPRLDGVEPKTRVVADAMRSLEAASALLIDETIDLDLALACANVPRVDLLPAVGANVYSILDRDHLVLSESAARSLADRLSP